MEITHVAESSIVKNYMMDKTEKQQKKFKRNSSHNDSPRNNNTDDTKPQSIELVDTNTTTATTASNRSAVDINNIHPSLAHLTLDMGGAEVVRQ